MRRKTPFVLAAGILLAGYAYAEKGYVIRDLGTFGGTSASVAAMNDRGQMVVNATGFIEGRVTRSFMVDGDRTSFLPLGFWASAITSRGDVAGTFTWGDVTNVRRAAIFQDHSMTEISACNPGCSSSSLATNPVLSQNGKGVDLARTLMDSLFPGAPASATGINDSGFIVGYGLGQNSIPVAFYGANSIFLTLNVDPDHPGKIPTAVNNRGTFIGYTGISSSCEPKRGFVVERGVYRLLPMTGTVQPRAINDSGVIAGTMSQSATCSPAFAFVLDGTSFTALPQLQGGSQSGALAINRSGDVAGYAYGPTGGSHAVVWIKH
jgi:uncharacterized membrane protein